MEAAFDSDYVNESESSVDEEAEPKEPEVEESSHIAKLPVGDFESIFRGRKPKRRQAEEDDLAARKRKTPPPYNNAYRELFNQVLKEAAAKCESDPNVTASVLGIVEWSAQEKDLLFQFIERHGQGDLRAISIAIGTKSPPEISDYLLLLRQSTREQDLKWEAKRVQLPDIPSADQISESCCVALDRAAEGLAVHQFAHEEKLERLKHGDFWLLDEAASASLESNAMSQPRNDAMDSVEEEQISVSPQLRQSLELLNLQRFLELSSRVFMNPGVSQPFDNWSTLAALDETPAIFATAFIDFHALVLSFTKRLISTTLFLANSRLRANDVKGWSARKLRVKRRDVGAALKILNIDQDSDVYWGGAARRLGLEVYDLDVRGSRISSMKLDDKCPMTYDEVEARMRERSRSPRSGSRSRSRGGSVGEEDNAQNATSEEMMQDQLEEPVEVIRRDLSPLYTSLPPSPLTEAALDFAQAQDTYASSLDRLASVREEYRLWNFLGEDPPTELPDIADLEAEMGKPPKRPRKLLTQLEEESRAVHWRDHVEYRADWERYGARIPEEAFEKLKRRVRHVSVGEENQEENEGHVESGQDQDATPSMMPRAQTPAIGLSRSRETSLDEEESDSDEEEDESNDEGDEMAVEEDVDSETEGEEDTRPEVENGPTETTDLEFEEEEEDQLLEKDNDDNPNEDSEEDQEMLDIPPSPDAIIPSIENRSHIAGMVEEPKRWINSSPNMANTTVRIPSSPRRSATSHSSR